MWDKLKNDKNLKDLLVKLITVLFVAVIALLLFDVLTQGKDGRRQIVDMDGGSEYSQEEGSALASNEEMKLEQILSEIKGVGKTSVMITYRNSEDTSTVFSTENGKKNPIVEGVIITSEGAGDIIVQSKIIDAVATLFDIPAANVMVFEKSDTNKDVRKQD